MLEKASPHIMDGPFERTHTMHKLTDADRQRIKASVELAASTVHGCWALEQTPDERHEVVQRQQLRLEAEATIGAVVVAAAETGELRAVA